MFKIQEFKVQGWKTLNKKNRSAEACPSKIKWMPDRSPASKALFGAWVLVLKPHRGAAEAGA
jgi:hypothetical protein